jgi:hypothetical protein
MSNSLGSFIVPIRVPSSAPGRHLVFGVGQRSHARAVAVFVVR